MRLDRYLFFIRLVKSRTLAQGLIEAGHVRLDGKRVAKTRRGGAGRIGHCAAAARASPGPARSCLAGAARARERGAKLL